MRKTTSGFTIVEVLVVITIIGILTAVGFVSYESIQSNARDAQRASRITVLAEALEKYYDKNGEYPSCTAMVQAPDTVANDTLDGIDPKVLSVPDASDGTNSILPLCADLTSEDDKFAYVGDGSDECKTGQACLQYVLKYKEEATGDTISVVSRRTVYAGGVATAPAEPIVTTEPNGSDIQGTITPVTCDPGSTAEYGINSRMNDGEWVGYSTWASAAATTAATKRVAIEGNKYEYKAQARCFVSNFSYSTNTTGPEHAYIKPITNAPTPPVVTANAINYATTTYTWPATTNCPTGTTPRYQYNFTTSYGFDFGWVTTYNTTVNFTTSTFGYTYSVQTKAQCYNGYSTGPWSAAGNNAGYYRPVPTVQVLVVGGGGAGGSSTSDDSGGGGGGGGVITHSGKTVYNQGYWVGVGGGGIGSGSNGQNSTFQDITALGGGGGGMTNEGGNNGGCGGGGAGAQDGSTNSRGISLQDWSGGGMPYGYDGGLGQWRTDGKAGGGGGGAGMVGGSGKDGGGNGKMNGGTGMLSSITGTNTYYAGGGGGGSCCYWGSGGAGGGGNGAENGHGNAGAANTGGGGGGGDGSGGGNGGSGIVIIRYATSALGASGGSAYTVGSDTVRIFYSSGTFQVY